MYVQFCCKLQRNYNELAMYVQFRCKLQRNYNETAMYILHVLRITATLQQNPNLQNTSWYQFVTEFQTNVATNLPDV